MYFSFKKIMQLPAFHLAIPVNELEESRLFYTEILDCKEGRKSTHWVDLNFFGHQLVLHESKNKTKKHFNEVDGNQVPVPHFGVILEWKFFHSFAKNLKKKKVQFEIEPYIRFKNLAGEQATMFFLDPSGNALEFKAFKNKNEIFKP